MKQCYTKLAARFQFTQYLEALSCYSYNEQHISCVLFKKIVTKAIFETIIKFKKRLFAPLRSINYLLLSSFLMANCVTLRTVTLIMPTRDIKIAS